ncbi:MAG: FtsQ-type POTRA domain-containing protein [Clostridiales bacterium]|nr:FtsQ-type POTRA domain-containing protein [Clostridiales bacterium]
MRQRRTALIRALGGVLLLGAVAFGAVTIYRSDALPVNRVLVDGIVNLSEDEVHAAAGVPEDATLLRLPVNEIEDRLLENPWIERVEISRSFPDAVRITITERTPVAYVDTGEAVLWLVDASGFVISSGVPDPEDARVVIRDLDGVEPVAGETLADPVAVNVLTILSGLSSELRGMVRAISAPSVDRTALITVDDVEVLVGSADDLDLKDTVARRILLEQQGAAVYIDVRTPERPTWRGLETPR